MPPSPKGSLHTSTRITETRPAIIDDVIAEFGEQVTVNLSQGATFFGMSSKVHDRVLARLENPTESREMSRYGDVLGIPELRGLWAQVVVNGYDETTGSIADDWAGADSSCLQDAHHLMPNQEFMITAGANQAFVNVVLATCDEGDEVLLLLPYYFSHFNALTMTGVSPVCVEVDPSTFLPNLNDLERQITERSKAIVVVNPGNPSGKIYPKDVMENIQAICKRYGIWLVIDEAYREFVYEGDSSLTFSPTDNDGIIHIFTASKAYGLAGWRIGAVQYPRRLSEGMRKAQDTIPTHASRLSQLVAYESLKQNPLYETSKAPSNVSIMNEVRKIFIKSLTTVYKGTQLASLFVIPDGAFYFFLPYTTLDRHKTMSQTDDMEAVKFLALDHSVLLTPGFAFGMSGYLRVSYGCIELSSAPEAAACLAKGMVELIQKRHTA